MKCIVVLLMCVSLTTFLHAQNKFTLSIIPLDKDTSFLSKEFSYRKIFTDSFSRDVEMQKLLQSFYKRGYLEASFELLKIDSGNLAADLHIGNKWEWAQLENGNVDPVILDRIGFREKLFEGDTFSIDELNRLLNNILVYCEDNGFPFAAVHLDSFQVEEKSAGSIHSKLQGDKSHLPANVLHAKIFLTKNKFVTIDSIHVEGDARISSAYLGSYLGFRLPSMYREDVIRNMPVRLRELSFLREEHPSKIIFNGNHATINLFLQKKNASRFDFILGVLPNSAVAGKLLITGDGQLNLVNPLGKGESINLHLSQLQSRTVQATVDADYPYLFRLPFGVDFNLNLYKFDTLYLNVKQQYGIQYLFTGANYLKAYFRNASTSVLTLDTNAIKLSHQLPQYLDVTSKFYGLEYKFDKLDYRFNPKKGFSFLLNGEAGTRKIKENQSVITLTDNSDPDFHYSSLYDSLDLKETQINFKGNFDKYWAITARSIIKTSYQGGFMISKQYLANELFRLGGFHLLRGFDEESIYASQYHIGTIEYHYILSQNSFFYFFFDGGYVENRITHPIQSDTPVGFGAGLNFETKAGIFGLTYALGQQQNNQIEFRAAKIHFGYVNYF